MLGYVIAGSLDFSTGSRVFPALATVSPVFLAAFPNSRRNSTLAAEEWQQLHLEVAHLAALGAEVPQSALAAEMATRDEEISMGLLNDGIDEWEI